MTEEPVDVLIIGAGASGAAVAYGLAETRMHIVCICLLYTSPSPRDS